MSYTASFYYDALLWAAILYGAGVVFKFGSVFLYEALMPWFSDHPSQKKAKPQLSKSQTILWWGLGGYLLLSGLVQIPPQLALEHKETLLKMLGIMHAPGIGAGLERAWVGFFALHPITYNILSFMIQAVLGIFLLTERATLLGKVTMVATALWGLIIAIFPEGLGFLLGSRNAMVSGIPGGFLVAAVAILLLIPYDRFSERMFLRRGRLVWGLMWGVGCVWQVLFFRSHRQAALYMVSPSFPQPAVITRVIEGIGRWATFDPVLANLCLMVGIAVVGVTVFFGVTGSRYFVLVILFLFWWINQDFGLLPQFGLMLNTAPLWILVAWALDESSIARAAAV